MIIVRGRDGRPSDQRTATFTGTVLGDSVLPRTSTDPASVTINTVTFLPGSRTFWHSHETGQILQVTAGEGWVCSDGGVPQVLRIGDTVWVPPGERHWHGATTDSYLVHVATSLGETFWEHEVEETDYRSTIDESGSTA